jgi:enterochelin esterase-like enzyme
MRSLAFHIAALSVVLATPSFGQPPAAPPAPRRAVVSPEIQADHRVTFRLAAPKATEVTLNGDWDVENALPMTKDDQGVWSATVGPLAPELWSYTFTVNGVRTLDPVNVDNSRDGQRLANIFIIPGPASANYAHNPTIPHGVLHQVWYPAPTMKMTRRAYIYTPPGYESGTTRYPVLYLHPGGNSDEDAWTSLGRLPQIMDGLIAQGKAKPMIVVMQNINPRQWAAPGSALLTRETETPAGAPQAAGAAQPAGRNQRTNPNWPLSEGHATIGESLVKDLIPFVEKNYRVDVKPESRAIVGLSQGGGPVVIATHRNPKMFAYVGLFSSRPQFDEPAMKDLNALKAAGTVKLYWVSAGDTDFAHDGAKVDFEIIQKAGFTTRWLETHGAHTWITWRMHISELAPLLFR